VTRGGVKRFRLGSGRRPPVPGRLERAARGQAEDQGREDPPHFGPIVMPLAESAARARDRALAGIVGLDRFGRRGVLS
jgi:hypothetical protein